MALNSLVVKCKKIFFLNKKCVHNFKLPAVFIIKQILVGNKKHKYNFVQKKHFVSCTCVAHKKIVEIGY